MFWVLKGEMGTMKGLFLAFVGLVVLHGGSLLSTHAAVHYYDFVLEETNFTKLCSTKSILTVNGSFPGPEIRVHAGDTAFVTIHNNGTYGYQGGYTPPSKPYFPSLPAYNNKTAVGNFTKLLRSLASKAHPVSVPLNITHRIFMTVSVNQIACANASCAGPNGNRLSASLNNISFVTPTIDILEAYYRYEFIDNGAFVLNLDHHSMICTF
ncbi:hypothetical protein SAY87_020626 [Trapa incisa]|uniref:Plastocyanin-like domain-containing protein n=1 Tax=Trapa incisa TaxID=236973 RepID=A0AAN7JR06_9MYRT|nr:hypothetical protein SAY87_020626 [Trapa incisa]